MIEIETSDTPRESARPVVRSIRCGWHQVCPACCGGRLYRAYLKVEDACPTCREALYHHRADDAPPYFTILIVAHIVVGGLLLMEQALAPPTWLHLAIWLPLTVLLSLLLLPRIKGALIGLQWALRMHGFAEADEKPADPTAQKIT